jgi:hypothetical protein
MELGVGHDDGEGDSRQAHPGTDVQDLGGRCGESAGKEQRITDVPVVDSITLVWPQSPGLHRLIE